jgi:hypothetical protein
MDLDLPPSFSLWVCVCVWCARTRAHASVCVCLSLSHSLCVCVYVCGARACVHAPVRMHLCASFSLSLSLSLCVCVCVCVRMYICPKSISAPMQRTYQSASIGPCMCRVSGCAWPCLSFMIGRKMRCSNKTPEDPRSCNRALSLSKGIGV